MNPFTALVWEVLLDSPQFLETLTAIMKREYKPFLLTPDATFRANAIMLAQHIRQELDKWYDWLPDTPINRIGGGLAVEMLDCVDFDHLARLVAEQELQNNVSALTIPTPTTTR